MGATKSKVVSGGAAEYTSAPPNAPANATQLKGKSEIQPIQKASVIASDGHKKKLGELLSGNQALSPDAKPFDPAVKSAALGHREQDILLVRGMFRSSPGQLDNDSRAQDTQAAEARAGVPQTTGNIVDCSVIKTADYLKMLRATQQQQQKQTEKNGPSLPANKSFSASLPKQSLGQMWIAAFKKDAALQGRAPSSKTQDDVASKTTPQDDTWLERMGADADLSEPVYWSDCDSVTRRDPRRHANAAAHFLPSAQLSCTAKLPSYVMQDLSPQLDRAVAMMLFRLQRFNDQRWTSNKDNVPSRRFVVGLKEVARRTKQLVVKCLIIAPDIDEAQEVGTIDDRIRELLAFAYQNSIPVIFALSRGGLGRAFNKVLNISIVGVLDDVGAKDLLVRATRLAGDARGSWLERHDRAAQAATRSHHVVGGNESAVAAKDEQDIEAENTANDKEEKVQPTRLDAVGRGQRLHRHTATRECQKQPQQADWGRTEKQQRRPRPQRQQNWQQHLWQGQDWHQQDWQQSQWEQQQWEPRQWQGQAFAKSSKAHDYW